MAQATNYIEQFEATKRRLELLATRVTRAQVTLEAQSKSYDEAVAASKASYGTSDLAEVRRIWTGYEADNAELVASFKSAVDDYERFVVRMEQALANPEAMADLLATMAPLEDPADHAAEPVQVASKPTFVTEDI